MLENKVQKIAYIGKKNIKRDTVAGTGTIWAGYGDVQEVMHGAAVRLLQHPTVWVTDAAFTKMQNISGAVTGSPKKAIQLPESEELTGAPGLSSSENPTGDDEDKDDDGEQTGTTPPADNRHASVKAAIVSLEQGNPEHFSEQTGNPIIAAVRNAANDATVTVKEVNAAWAELKK